MPGESDNTGVGYSQGLAIKTGLQSVSTVEYGPNYMLTIPERTASGQCSWFAPVRFLNDSDGSCPPLTVTSSSCSTEPRLNALSYAQSQSWGISVGPVVLAEQVIVLIVF